MKEKDDGRMRPKVKRWRHGKKRTHTEERIFNSPLSDLTNSLKNVVQILKRWGLYNNPRCRGISTEYRL